MADKLKITLVKSTIGAVPKHKKTVEALGLKKLNKTVVLPDNAATRGMIKQVQHLVTSVRSFFKSSNEVCASRFLNKSASQMQPYLMTSPIPSLM